MAEAPEPLEKAEFDLNNSLSDLQRLTAQVHEFYTKANKGGEKEYELLMRLRAAAGNVDHEPIAKEEMPIALEKISEITSQIKERSEFPEENPLFKSLDKLQTDLKEANEVFGFADGKDGGKKGLSRRDFLKAAGVVVTAGTIHAIDTQRMGQVPVVESDSPSEFEQNIKFIKEKYGIEIYTGLPLSTAIVVGYEQPQISEIEQAVRYTRTALANYPDDFFRNIGLSQVALVKDLKYASGGRLGGVMHQLSATLAVTTEYGEEDFKHVFNHEVYHAGDLGSNLLYYFRNAAQEDLSVLSGDIIKINDEEAAWIAGTMMTPDGYKDIQDRIASGADVVSDLDQKVKQIKTDYSRWSGGKMNDQYWQDLLDGKVDENYWI